MADRQAGWHLRLERVSLQRAGRLVLDDVTVGMDRGRVAAIVGPSGAGKTSLLRCLNRLEEPTSGRVLLDGGDVRDLDARELRRRVGMVFQTPVLFPGDVRSNLAYGLERVEADESVSALVAARLSGEILARDAQQLSVGEAQRVCIARALVHDPQALLLDEPTSALDRDAAAGIESLVRSLAGRGLSVVMVTHDLDQARRVADDAVVLARGRVAAVGPITEVADVWAGGGG